MTNAGNDPLLRGLAAGDERAFAALYDQYGTRLYRTAYGILGRREDTEDAVQEVFTALVRSRKTLAGVNDLTAYLFSALRRAAAHCAERETMNRRRRQPWKISKPKQTQNKSIILWPIVWRKPCRNCPRSNAK